MFWLKHCPKCHGDLFDDVDEGGIVSIQCLQCGRTCTFEEQTGLLCLAGRSANSSGLFPAA